MAKYVYDMTRKVDRDKLFMEFEGIKILFKTKKFREFIADKCLEVLDDICNTTEFWTEHSIWEAKVEEYKHNHKVDIGNDYILVYNDTYYQPEELDWLSDRTKPNYAEGIPVSYLIEYGMGVSGDSHNDWQTNISTPYKRDGGRIWVGNNPDIGKSFYASREGKFIYLKLAMQVEQRFEDWVNEYVGVKER